MAVFTFIAISTVVLVILAMTTYAADCKGDLGVRRCPVAFGTADILVLSLQLEACLIMIEIPVLPVPRVVAITAVSSQGPLMHVLL